MNSSRLKVFCLLTILNFTTIACAQLPATDPVAASVGEEILGPYPEVGSDLFQQDFEQLLYFQKTRTQEQCDAAALEVDSSMETFFGGAKGPLSKEEVLQVKQNLKWLTIKTGTKIFYYKYKFARPRPYVSNPEIKPCIELESSKAYPSGHTTLARVYARVLAVIFPEREAQFLQRADEIALNRIIGGVHHPSDIVAGKKLGDYIADDYLKDTDFREEMLELKKVVHNF